MYHYVMWEYWLWRLRIDNQEEFNRKKVTMKINMQR